MKIGIIGKGFVGGAVYTGLQQINNEVTFYDPKYKDSKYEDILDTECVFVCVPTNEKENGDCDVSIVEEVIQKLFEYNYSGIIAIKSTVIPGTTKKLQEQYKTLKLCFIPEFLRERSALTDFMEKQYVLIIGSDDINVIHTITNAYGNIPKNIRTMTTTEAELAKYFTNVYNALRITFANGFFEVCENLDCDYQRILSAVVLRDNISLHYLRASKNLRGFGGYCLPKDTKAFSNLVKKLKLDISIFKSIIDDNKKYLTTVFKGMRK